MIFIDLIQIVKLYKLIINSLNRCLCLLFYKIDYCKELFKLRIHKNINNFLLKILIIYYK